MSTFHHCSSFNGSPSMPKMYAGTGVSPLGLRPFCLCRLPGRIEARESERSRDSSSQAAATRDRIVVPPLPIDLWVPNRSPLRGRPPLFFVASLQRFLSFSPPRPALFHAERVAHWDECKQRGPRSTSRTLATAPLLASRSVTSLRSPRSEDAMKPFEETPRTRVISFCISLSPSLIVL